MIKQLQLRGISRTPSDRASADGGCAESLNVHLDINETAPTLPPDDISADIYGSLTRYPIVYIHKMLGVTNYIGYIHPGGTTNNGFYAYGSDVSSHSMGSSTLMPYTETLKHITSIGNTLIIFTDTKPYYFLYKDHAYSFLGSEIPKAAIEVITKPTGETWSNRSVEIDDGPLATTSVSTASGTKPDIDMWNAAVNPNDENHAELLATMQNVWDAISLGMSEKRYDGVFFAPFFIRYALRLYDGSYMDTSTPILCGASASYRDWMSSYIYGDFNGGHWHMGVELNNLFKVRVKGDYNIGNWGDIIKSIDIFASTPIYAPSQHAEASSFDATGRLIYSTTYGWDVTFEGMQSTAREASIRNEVLSKGNFYKVLSIDLNNSADMTKLTNGTMVIDNADNVSGDTQLVQDGLPDTYRDNIQYLPVSDAQNFNSRTLLIGADELLSTGDTFLNGLTIDNGATLDWVTFRYKIVNPVNGSVNYVVSRNRLGGTQIQPGYFYGDVQKFGDEIYTKSSKSSPYAWICYPDTRCTEVEVTYHTTSDYRLTKRIPLEKHPLLECVYAYFGMSTSLQQFVAYNGSSATYSTDETRKMSNGNKLLLSEFENPFVFPAGNIITFNDKLIGAATTSVPLPNGEVGAFPLYAFTEGGIRVLVTTAEGTFASEYAHPNMSRHIALPGTIMGMEQAVVFITKKGVMMVSGNQVTELSANMNGAPYILDASLYTPASGTSEAGGILAVRPWRGQGEPLTDAQWLDMLSAVNGGETLMQYMENAKVAYDNNGARLLFFNPSKDYQYVYMLQTQTWHKTVSGVLNPTILNSYPDCLIAYTASGTPKVLDFSTILDSASLLSDVNNPVYGIIVTRPFDLGEPDIRKSLNDIRIRGKYNRADVYYILLGSFDGINWQRMTSLRGGSYKMFRMVLLTRLTATERVTWVDVDYDTRFTNRLR